MADTINYGTTPNREGKDRYFNTIVEVPSAREFGPGLGIIGEPPSLKVSNGVVWSGEATYAINIPLILPSSGSVGNNGALTLTTALPETYPNCYMWFEAGVVYAGSVAGMYYVEMVSTTQGIIYAEMLDGLPTAHENPTALVTTGPGAYTQIFGTSAATNSIKILAIPFAGGSLGKQGNLLFNPVFRLPGTATRKTTSFSINSTINGTNQYDSSGALHVQQAAPVMINFAGYNLQRTPTVGLSSGTSSAMHTSTEDTSIDFTASVYVRLRDDGADFVVLESLRVSATYGE